MRIITVNASEFEKVGVAGCAGRGHIGEERREAEAEGGEWVKEFRWRPRLWKRGGGGDGGGGGGGGGRVITGAVEESG